MNEADAARFAAAQKTFGTKKRTVCHRIQYIAEFDGLNWITVGAVYIWNNGETTEYVDPNYSVNPRSRQYADIATDVVIELGQRAVDSFKTEYRRAN